MPSKNPTIQKALKEGKITQKQYENYQKVYYWGLLKKEIKKVELKKKDTKRVNKHTRRVDPKEAVWLKFLLE